ncbi:solute carrier family 23 member 2-like isoform X2 [Mercenaria mercenaria]|uniref:solute carrier family 23 member 2-like isoform X2 n=1 Tax=Mercenaria mercenaria TaxID=6596 RepID=UPI00234F78DD|nr:solute carrier family 23 member 2-like isoform X2 [Mercenaria mercenaria]
MCSVTCTSYVPTQNFSKLACKAYNNDAFDGIKSEKKLEIETDNDNREDKQFRGQDNAERIENDDGDIEAEGKMESTYRMHYKVGDVPAPHLSFMFGLQQVLLSISSTISIPLIVANEICAGDLDLVKSEIMSTFLFMCGVCTILQTAVGVRLPIIQGGCHKFIPAVAALMALPIWKCPDLSPVESMGVTGNGSEANFTLVPRFTDDERTTMWQSRMKEIQGGIILSALVQVVIGCTGILGLILNFIGPITIVPTITLVGLSLIDVALRFCQVHWGITSLTVCLVFLFSLYMSEIKLPLPAYSKRRKCHITMYPVFKLLPVILAVAISWGVCAILTVTDRLSSDPKSQEYFTRTDARTNVLETAEWFFFPYPGQWGLPTVSIASFMAMLAATMTSIIESVGDYYACARISCVSPPPTHAVNRGIAIEGFGSILSGIVGSGGATTSYSQNVGAIGFTKVASRRAFQVAGLIFLLCGLCGKFGALLTQLPDPVLGGIVLVSFGMVTAVGLSNLQFVSLQSSRNLVIIGTSLLIGLMAPRYIAANPGCIKTGDDEVDRVLTVLLSTAMFVGGFVGFVLDNTVPGSDEERGIKSWRKTYTADPNNVDSIEDDTYDLPFIMNCLRQHKWTTYIPFLPTFRFSIGKYLKGLCSKCRDR